MATLHVRNVPEALYEALRARAQLRGRSIGNEAIALLSENVARGVVHGVPHTYQPAKGLAPRERLDDASAQVLAAASYEAHALGHDDVDTEHLLLALLADGGVAARLQAFGVAARDVRGVVERSVERGESSDPGPRPFAPGAKRILERALRESLAQGEGVISATDVLLALVGDEEGVAGRVLRELGVDLDQARGARILDVAKGIAITPPEEYCAIALTGSAEAWTEELIERAQDGWQLFQILKEGDERRAVRP